MSQDSRIYSKVIRYPHPEYLPSLHTQMLERTRGLPPYKRNPAKVDFEAAPMAYALNISLIHDPEGIPGEAYVPSPRTEVALFERGSGHGTIGARSGISGYIDTLGVSDPIAHTVREELHQECGLNNEAIAAIRLHAGESFELPRTIFPGARILIVPLVGLCASRPNIAVDGYEVRQVEWEPLATVARRPDLENGYLEHTLPRCLGALGMQHEQIGALLGGSGTITP